MSFVTLLAFVAVFHPHFAVAKLDPARMAAMRQTSWHPGCPVALEDLRLLSLPYLDYSGTPQQGQLIVHQALANETVSLFRGLYKHGFRIERMQPVDEYGGSDERSMAANNTSAFNCRDITGSPGRFSNHSWGRAIDFNPLTNPFVLHGKPLPPEGARYLDRIKPWPGLIREQSYIVRLFQAHGWTWGGKWTNPDLQHFEKPQLH